MKWKQALIVILIVVVLFAGLAIWNPGGNDPSGAGIWREIYELRDGNYTAEPDIYRANQALVTAPKCKILKLPENLEIEGKKGDTVCKEYGMKCIGVFTHSSLEQDGIVMTNDELRGDENCGNREIGSLWGSLSFNGVFCCK